MGEKRRREAPIMCPRSALAQFTPRACTPLETSHSLAHSPFFLSSGLPFFTDPKQKSPTQAAGRRFCLVPHRVTAMMFRFFAPLLSPHWITCGEKRGKGEVRGGVGRGGRG